MKHRSTNIKIIRSGDRLEITRYQNPVNYGESPNENKIIKINPDLKVEKRTETQKIVSRYTSSRRSKSTLTRLVYANAYQWPSIKGKFVKPTFLSLTFAENIQNLKQANNEFTKFIKRLNYEITGKKTSFLKYVVVIEFQKRGAIHYHVLFFNFSYLKKKKLTEIWRQGILDIERTKGDDTQEIISYLCKYMSKKLEDERLCGQKSYFCSRELKKPIVRRDQNRNSFFLEFYGDDLETIKEFSKKYNSEYCGEFNYSIHNLAKDKELKANILAFEELLKYNE